MIVVGIYSSAGKNPAVSAVLSIDDKGVVFFIDDCAETCKRIDNRSHAVAFLDAETLDISDHCGSFCGSGREGKDRNEVRNVFGIYLYTFKRAV